VESSVPIRILESDSQNNQISTVLDFKTVKGRTYTIVPI